MRSPSRDACTSEFCRHASRNPVPFASPRRRRSAERRTLRVPHLSVRRASSSISPICGRERSERARLSAPHRGIPKVLTPRLGPSQRFLESPDPNGRTLSGTSAASTSQSDHAPDELMLRPPGSRVYSSAPGNRPRSVFRSTLAKASFVERDDALYLNRRRLSHHVSVTVTIPKRGGYAPGNGHDGGRVVRQAIPDMHVR